ncbi:NAD(P)/FAD-dependent oxidoreductase [Streptantibioticus ferralitis]|uniref:FAD-dependent oxidoreductase n=1 Tax=Streptantibioticus ferralitis TaxID=236510 RepID=A0ABT5Z410_9ACTN|nr:FAD-dependent oxidoreductase [Streptantibioticus ferralitis]MDF2258563.1 FAD-dependent oxidoreductase [Streptantibioticus ferralitis]
MTTPHRILIIGASLGGLSTAEALRREGYDGTVTLVGAEPHLPYDRPPLSKQVLAGTWDPDRAQLPAAAQLDGLDIELLMKQEAVGLRPAERVVQLRDGERLRYDTLVIATGLRPRWLPGSRQLDGVHVVRTLDDALALRQTLRQGPRLVVVGGGFIGMEVAATARSLGVEVTVVDPHAHPLAGRLGGVVGDAVLGLHRDHGVRFRLGQRVSGLAADGNRSVVGVLLADGSVIDADAVVLGLGSIPTTQWLKGSGVPVGDGVLCDQYCAAAPGIYAVGDIANWLDVHSGRRRRVEHRTNASEQAVAVARNILADHDKQTAYTPTPYLWSDQFDCRIQCYGWADEGQEVHVVEGDPAGRKFIALHRDHGRVMAVVGMNSARGMRSHLGALGSTADPVGPSRAQVVNPASTRGQTAD